MQCLALRKGSMKERLEVASLISAKLGEIDRHELTCGR